MIPGRPGGRLRFLLTPAAVAAGLILLALYVTHQTARLGDDQILNWSFLQGRLVQHVELTATSFLIASAIALPLGVVFAQLDRVWSLPVFFIANLGQVIPSIAMLALAFTFVGLGFKPTVAALVLYALLPILRNTVVGVQGVDQAAVEAARGMGMTRVQTLIQVQLPLAAPVIFGGLRTALVLVIGTATLGNFIGGGGLGDVIDAGISSGRDRIVLSGAGIVAGLALLADWLLGAIEHVLTPRM